MNVIACSCGGPSGRLPVTKSSFEINDVQTLLITRSNSNFLLFEILIQTL